MCVVLDDQLGSNLWPSYSWASLVYPFVCSASVFRYTLWIRHMLSARKQNRWRCPSSKRLWGWGTNNERYLKRNDFSSEEEAREQGSVLGNEAGEAGRGQPLLGTLRRIFSKKWHSFVCSESGALWPLSNFSMQSSFRKTLLYSKYIQDMLCASKHWNLTNFYQKGMTLPEKTEAQRDMVTCPRLRGGNVAEAR